ncbi:type I restriction and modification enzyme subunit R-like protein [Algoriphagus aquaeductus]|uniref:Type I restriction and modification enzyme subunit R-like protein n=1 Tax=Algoriphagus aquaeductus TaxID=475299 RepID=A0A326S088_9BACT|nr:type I restriction enzyme HsdR N-terminal domain-containing protein [Algoriphagus aquaeductus]PZV84399.1 type I restriction and modification enzyme subunit R-like protein [Algoriphagus aquaeductus]
MNSGQDPLVKLPHLNLPSFEPNLQESNGRLLIFDSLRKKNLLLTPEEWVRQHWIHYLIRHLDYPAGLVSIEKGMKYNQLQKRTDLVVFDREGKAYLLIECKAPEISLNENVLRQAMTYHQKIQCPHLILSNGLKHLVFSWVEAEQKLVQSTDLPHKPK